MAYKTIADLKTSVSGILQGLNLNSVKNINTALERTARETCVTLDIPEAVLKQQLNLYDKVYNYLSPTNIFGTAEVDLRTQATDRTESDFVYKMPLEQFDREKAFVTTGVQTTFEFDSGGVGVLRVASNLPAPSIDLDPMTATTGWTAAGTASGLTQDSNIYYNAPSSLRFNLTTGTGTLTKTIPSTDFTSYVGTAMAFLAMRTPNVANLTSITLKIGSSASNYYTLTVTTGFLKTFTVNEWMLDSFDQSLVTTVGTPVVTAITYVQISIVVSGAITNFYVGDLWAALPFPVTLLYQTSALFLPSGGSTPLNTITNDADTVVLNDAAFVIYEHMCARAVALQQGGTLASNFIGTIDQTLNGMRGFRGVLIQPGLLDLYRADNPSQEIRPVGNYYDD